MIYVFSCSNCEARSELDYKMGKAPRVVPCPSCGGRANRVYEATAVIFKGEGWPSHAGRRAANMTAENERAGVRMRENRESLAVKFPNTPPPA